MTFIWSTRGRTWGFRFLRSGGSPDPFAEYAKAFSGIEQEREVWRRTQEVVALRFATPGKLQDSAGRDIPQEFVLFGALASQINSVQEGIDKIWPTVAEEFKQIWDRAEAPPAAE
ncbi:hypothetical protein [Cryobacterium sp. TMT2-42-4]|uniref:hypothetical protein n=1 Tax=Cryobacterium sp. TMT2-42-4 TaxID=1259255 RepID=UPI00106B0CD6|nr:hypothetical protein [Cryobacterium sp. TMT2-42-4]TFC34120.1 hypothetical protein E3O18_12580 [Cryobacterium sp. TMT2-42-4]